MKQDINKHPRSRQTAKERRRRQKGTGGPSRTLIVVGIVGLALAFVGVLIASSGQNPFAPAATVVPITPFPRPEANQNATGDPNAPVKMDEYSDFQCPACLSFSKETERSIVEQYVATNKVYFVYHTMGEWIGPESAAAAEAAYCAGDQGRFWDYHDILFDNWTGENVGAFNSQRLLAFGEALGLKMDEFRACLDNHKYASRVAQDKVEGEKLGVTATPTFFINGKQIVGAQSFTSFQQEIEAALAAAKQ
jgi:protein-disulfide isomerase